MDCGSTYTFGNVVVPNSMYFPDSDKFDSLLTKAFSLKNSWPQKIFFPKDNPVEEFFQRHCEDNGIQFELVSLSDFEEITGEFASLLRQNIF